MRCKLKTRRSNFRWSKVDTFILTHFIYAAHTSPWSGKDFVQLCAVIGRTPRAVVQRLFALGYTPEKLGRLLPFTASEIEDMNERLAVLVKRKDPSIRWDDRPRKRKAAATRFTLAERGGV